jgi:3-oxoacyl-[acyl-carrier protein] reductase
MTTTYIISGSQSKIGLQIIKDLLKKGSTVFPVDLKLDRTQNGMRGDISDPDFVSEIFSTVLEHTSEIRLINLAGITLPEIGVYPIESWKKTLEINAFGTFLLLREFHLRLVNSQILSGSIVTVSSAISNKSLSDNPAYPASKLAVESLTRHYANRFAQYNVSVNCISPGYIESGMTESSYNKVELREKRSNLSYLKRWGKVEEVSELALFLMDKNSTFVTGAIYHIDGGWSSNSDL